MENLDLNHIRSEFQRVQTEMNEYLKTVTPQSNKDIVFETVLQIAQQLDPTISELMKPGRCWVARSREERNTEKVREERELAHDIKKFIQVQVPEQINHIMQLTNFI